MSAEYPAICRILSLPKSGGSNSPWRDLDCQSESVARAGSRQNPSGSGFSGRCAYRHRNTDDYLLPLTTQVYPAFKQWRVTVTARHRLIKDCQVIVDQPRTLDRSRFGEGPLATLSEEEMISVERAFLGVCGMFHYAIRPR